MNYVFHILIMLNLYIILALSINLIVGYTGLLTIAHAAFYGLGAYAYTLIVMNLNLPFPLALLLAIVIIAIISTLLSLPLIRLKGDPFAIATLAIQVIIYTLLYNWTALTRGPYGIPGIPKPVLFGFKFNSIPSFLILSTVLMVIVLLIFITISRSKFALILKGIREDEMAIISGGRNPAVFKRYAFVIGSTFAVLSGFLFATYVTYIDPTSFTLDESIFILSIIIIGGSGNIKGPIIGAIFMVLLPELLRFVGIPDSIAANLRQIIYGALLILVMRLRPQGILGEYDYK